jgi:hypothetical protein
MRKKMKCPECGKEEIDSMTPRTIYACGSSDYDKRHGTFIKGIECKCAKNTGKTNQHDSDVISTHDK